MPKPMPNLLADMDVPLGWQAPLIGAPWVLDAGGPDRFDCWGLVSWAWATLAGLDLSPFRGGEAQRDLPSRHVQIAARADSAITAQRFVQLDRPRLLAIGVVRFKRFPVHVGLYAQDGHFVHACEDSGAVRQDPVDSFATRAGSRITGWWWPAADVPKIINPEPSTIR